MEHNSSVLQVASFVRSLVFSLYYRYGPCGTEDVATVSFLDL